MNFTFMTRVNGVTVDIFRAVLGTTTGHDANKVVPMKALTTYISSGGHCYTYRVSTCQDNNFGILNLSLPG